MNNLLLLTKKNLTLLVRSKSSALIVFFAPLLLILILGLSFNTTSKYGLNIGVHAPTYTDELNTFIANLKEQEFNVVKYEKTIGECIEDIKLGVMHTCIELPSTFQVQSNTPAQVTFYVDQSKINLVWMIRDTMDKNLGTKEQQISENIAKDILTKLSDTNTKVTAEKTRLASIKEKSSSASKSTEDTKKSLAGLDLTATNNTYDTTILETFKTDMLTSLTTTSEKLTSAKNQITKTEMNATEKKKITTYLEAASTSLDNAQSLITTATNATAAPEFDTITILISSLQTDLATTQSKLTTASTKISTNNNNLESVKTTLTETITLLDTTQATLDQINSNLQSQKVTESKVVSEPLITKIEPITQEKTHLNYLLPVILVLVIMFSSLLLGTSLVMMEKNSPAFMRNFFLPIRKINFILSIYLTNVVLILIQVIIIMLLSLFFLTDIYTTLPMLAIILFLSATIFTFLGMLIGYIFTSEETGVLASISLGSLLLFISGAILPLEATSSAIRQVISFSPFVISERLIREVFIFNSPFTSLWMDFLILISYGLILFLITVIAESVMHKHLLERFLKNHHQTQRQNDKLNKNGQ